MGWLSKGIRAGIRAASRSADGVSARASARQQGRSLAVNPPSKTSPKRKPEGGKPLAVAVPPNPRFLPAPARPLALPAPPPPLPSFAVKPRGGQWAPQDRELIFKRDLITSPAGVADEINETTWPFAHGLLAWYPKAVQRYLERDYGTPDDPLRPLAEQGRLPMVPNVDLWDYHARGAINQTPAGVFIGPDVAPGFRSKIVEKYPWMATLPVTEPLYHLNYRFLPLETFRHTRGEIRNALDPTSGLPDALRLAPESLQRMSFPQAVERVANIDAWRVKNKAEVDAQRANNAAAHVFKEYPDDNPLGLRWVELKEPDPDTPLPDGWMRDGDGFYNDHTGDTQRAHPLLQDALKYEGETMGHCVGAYCDDVADGNSRIFSLRDAKGEPHVTIETSPRHPRSRAIPDDVEADIYKRARAATDEVSAPLGIGPDDPRWQRTHGLNVNLMKSEWLRNNPVPDDIVQIKGKQNAAPKDDYLPFVQDFVRSGNWGEIGELSNAGLLRFRGDLVPAQEFFSMAEEMRDWFEASPYGQLSRTYWGDDIQERAWGTPLQQEMDEVISRPIATVGDNKLSINNIHAILDDPTMHGATADEINDLIVAPILLDQAFQAIDYLKAHQPEVPLEQFQRRIADELARQAPPDDFARGGLAVRHRRCPSDFAVMETA